MLKPKNKHIVLVLGASGFIGHAIYTELCAYFQTYGTYCNNNPILKKNQHFFKYNIENDDIFELLQTLSPTIVISALRGNFAAQIIAHKHLCEYSEQYKTKLIFLSSANVFDAYSKYPSYENHTTLSNSIYGHFKIKIENILLNLPKKQTAILRLPMVFGNQSPRVETLKTQLEEKKPIEVFPNLIINVTSCYKLTQQIHYIINRNKHGVFHLGSKDLVHHADFIKDVIKVVGIYNPIFKFVYTTNNDRYLAVLPKYNMLPKHLQTHSDQVINELAL